jgi:hypothetical protein
VPRRRQLLDLRPVGLERDERLLVRRALGEGLADDLQLGGAEIEDLEVPPEAVAERVELLVLRRLEIPDRLLGRGRHAAVWLAAMGGARACVRRGQDRRGDGEEEPGQSLHVSCFPFVG